MRLLFTARGPGLDHEAHLVAGVYEFVVGVVKLDLQDCRRTLLHPLLDWRNVDTERTVNGLLDGSLILLFALYWRRLASRSQYRNEQTQADGGSTQWATKRSGHMGLSLLL